MIIDKTDLAMSELSRKLAEELKNSSYRILEDKTGVSRGSLENIINKTNVDFPKLETLDKLATYFKMPLWRVIEMAGIDLGLNRSVSDTIDQLNSLARRMPEIEPIVVYLLKLYPEDLRGVVAYLEALDRQRNRAQGWTE